MELQPYVDRLNEQLAVSAAAGGEEARLLAQRLTAGLEAAVRLTLLEALSAAAAEITTELAPGAVELRLRGGEPEFVIAAPMAGSAGEEEAAALAVNQGAGAGAAGAAADGAMTRINLRLPDRLKTEVEQRADREGLSTNAWLVRAVAAALGRDPAAAGAQRPPSSGQRFTGWAR